MITAGQKDLGIRFGITLLATILIAPVAAAFLPPIPAHRVVTRVFLISLILSLLIKRRKRAGESASMREVMVRLRWCRPHRLYRFTAGVVLAAVMLGSLLAVSLWCGGRVWEHKPPGEALWQAVLSAAFTAVVVAYLEEALCRGYLFNVIGGWMSAFFYAAVHYFRPISTSPPADGYDALLTFKTIPYLMEAWADPRNVTLGIGTLFVFGLALNTMRRRTDTLYLGIGVHAGLVLALKLYPRWIHAYPKGSEWVWGANRLHDGVAGLLMLLALWAIVKWTPLPKKLRPEPS